MLIANYTSATFMGFIPREYFDFESRTPTTPPPTCPAPFFLRLRNTSSLPPLPSPLLSSTPLDPPLTISTCFLRWKRRGITFFSALLDESNFRWCSMTAEQQRKTPTQILTLFPLSRLDQKFVSSAFPRRSQRSSPLRTYSTRSPRLIASALTKVVKLWNRNRVFVGQFV